MSTLTVPVHLLDPDIDMPAYAYDGDAGMDLRATESATLQPFERALIGTGISMAIPKGYAGFVLPRSGLAIKHGISVVNAPGLIDSNYRGEIKVVLVNQDAHESFSVKRGDRIAQLVIMRVENLALQSVASLDESERGAGGFGSSGVSA